MTLETIFGEKLHRPEILDIFGLEEHPSAHTLLFVALQWVTCKNDSFKDDLERIRRHHDSCCSYNIDTIRLDRVLGEAEHLAWGEDNRANGCGDGWHVVSHESHELKFLGG